MSDYKKLNPFRALRILNSAVNYMLSDSNETDDVSEAMETALYEACIEDEIAFKARHNLHKPGDDVYWDQQIGITGTYYSQAEKQEIYNEADMLLKEIKELHLPVPECTILLDENNPSSKNEPHYRYSREVVDGVEIGVVRDMDDGHRTVTNSVEEVAAEIGVEALLYLSTDKMWTFWSQETGYLYVCDEDDEEQSAPLDYLTERGYLEQMRQARQRHAGPKKSPAPGF